MVTNVADFHQRDQEASLSGLNRQIWVILMVIDGPRVFYYFTTYLFTPFKIVIERVHVLLLINLTDIIVISVVPIVHTRVTAIRQG